MTAMNRDVVPGMAEAIERRRKELGLTPGAFVEAAGITAPGLAPLRRGERRNYSESVRLGVARALRWSPDSIDRLLDGKPPKPATTPDVPGEIADQLRDLLKIVQTGRAETAALKALVESTAQELHTRIESVERALLPTKPLPRKSSRQPTA